MVKGRNSEKVLGCDDFSRCSSKYVGRGRYYGVFRDFNAGSKFEKSLNATFIVLVL